MRSLGEEVRTESISPGNQRSHDDYVSKAMSRDAECAIKTEEMWVCLAHSASLLS